MRLYELLKGAELPCPGGFENVEITGITADSKKVRRGMVFVAIRGLHCDGLDFIREAYLKGAALVIGERGSDGFPCLIVENAREAWAKLLNAWYENPTKNMALIGITGTNGKTSTSAMLYAILRRAGLHCGLIGTVDRLLDDHSIGRGEEEGLANMTTPDPDELYALLAQMRDGGATHVVMEVSSHALAFSKTAPLRFERAVFTNLTRDHLDLHGDMEGYFEEKKKLFQSARGAVVSCLGRYGQRLADGLEIPLQRLEKESVSELALQGSRGSCFTLRTENGEKIAITLPVAGDFSIENASLAALTAHSLGISSATITGAIAAFKGVCGRMERVTNAGEPAVFLDYAHTPDALERLLCSVRRFRESGQQIILLFGCGGDRDRGKRAEMGRIASRLADLTVITSDNCRGEDPQAIIRDILKGIDKEKPYKVIVDRAEAIAYAIDQAKETDILLLTGKGHETYEICGQKRLSFNERELVRACMRRRAKGEA